MNGPRLLILETSSRVGQVALAEGDRLVQVRRLDEARRHARDLAPALQTLLAAQGWKARDLHGVIVSRGPGSYTGLRVGIMSAKTVAYATGCTLLAIDTFAAIAHQAPAEALLIDVVADAQQDKVYVQRFERKNVAAELAPVFPLTIRPMTDWLGQLDPAVWVTGPGLQGQANRLRAGQPLVAPEHWDPQPASLLALGLQRYERSERDDFWTLEPLYLRPSAAEEKWQKKNP